MTALQEWKCALFAVLAGMAVAACGPDRNSAPPTPATAGEPRTSVARSLPSAPPAPAQTCLRARGRKAAQALVDLCLEVSPATHPPCNVENSCALIEDEIARGCAMLGADAPAGCPRRP